MQSQAATLVFSAHFVLSLPASERLRRTGGPGALAPLSKIANTEGREATT